MKNTRMGATVCGAVLALMVQHAAVAAVTDYVVTGSFYGDYLEVINYDEETGDEVYVDAFLTGLPLNIYGAPSPTFTLSFSVDESVDGRVPLFSSVALFDDAVSNISLDINGSNVLSSPQTETVQQFPGSNGFYSRWSWGLFSENIALPGVEVIDAQSGQSIANLNAEFLNFALYDPTNTIYSGGFPLDLIRASLSDFSNTDFSIYWGMSSGGENGDPFGEFNGEASYRVLGNIESLVAVPQVPLPAAAWMFLSAVSGLLVLKRKQTNC